VESKDEVLVKEGRVPEGTPAMIPPPIFLRWHPAASILCFSCFSAASSWDHRWEGLYIGFFRLSWASGDEDGRHRRSKAQTSLGGATWLGGRATRSCLTSRPPLMNFLISSSFSW
jgi:hypothetical protein